MKKILTILGQEVIIMFNMAVQISFEEITGKPFSEIDTNVSKDSLALAYSAIIANNPDCNITVDNLMHDASGAELNAVIKAISDSFVEKSASQSSRYCEETEKMARYMQQLNAVYEKMITAMTINMYNPAAAAQAAASAARDAAPQE